MTDRQLAPQWTPDGSHVVLPAGNGSIYTVKADGSDLRRIAKEDGDYVLHLSPDVSPDGSRLVYATSRHKLKKDDAPHREQEELRHRDGPAGRVRPAPADRRFPSGRVSRVVAGRRTYCLGEEPLHITCRMRASTPWLPTAPTSGGSWTMTGWSLQATTAPEPPTPRAPRRGLATGPSLLLSFTREGHWSAMPRNALYTVNADGTDLRRMFTVELRIPYGTSVRHTLIVGQPKWSPDGRKLAFFRLRIPEPISRQNDADTVHHQSRRVRPTGGMATPPS